MSSDPNTNGAEGHRDRVESGTPNLSLGNKSGEVYREIKCCFSVTIRRDAWGVPVAIMGQWIVSDICWCGEIAGLIDIADVRM